MSQSERAKRFAQRVAGAPSSLIQMRQLVAVTHDVVASTQTQLDELRATLEAVSKAHLEALAFLTRSTNEISARLEKLERAGAMPDQ
jgi:hypothetical protein